jgi:hypothetical protein
VSYLRFLRQLIPIVALLFTCWGPAKAQGFYYSYTIDDVSVDTETVGYGNSTGCGGGGIYGWSLLQGDYGSGYTPFTIDQSVPTVDGQDYNWSIGFAIQVPDPYGDCYTAQYQDVLFQGPLRRIVAYYYGNGTTTARRCNPNNACDTLVGGNIPVTFMLATVYQIQIGLVYQCGIPRDNPPKIVDRCYSPDPEP